MPTASEIAGYADTLLETTRIPDYPQAMNGLQVDSPAQITKVAAAVDFSGRTAKLAIASGAGLLIVHHGAFWQGSAPITGKRYEVIANLVTNAVGVYSSHIPLDCHPALGNNVLLAKELGLRPASGFGNFNGIEIGISGVADVPLESLTRTASEFCARHGGKLRVTHHSPARQVGRWAMCTGSGADTDTLREALALGVKTLIVGEGPHWTSVFGEENDIVILYVGHYASETLGVQALASSIAKEFGIAWEFIAAPTGS